MKVYIHTYGCQMNARDSEAAGAMLHSAGHEIVPDEPDADAIIVNTCSVRSKAEDKALGKLRLMVATKRTHPGRIVGVMGCMAQRSGEDLYKMVPGLDFVLGTQQLSELQSICESAPDGTHPVLNRLSNPPPDSRLLSGHRINGISAFVKASEGCNRQCSYCIVPAVRGEESSRPLAVIVSEISGLIDRGVREITLLGQSVTSYGLFNDVGLANVPSALGLTEPFPRLLEAVAGLSNLKRIRFTTSHPSGITAGLIRVMQAFPNICEHIHLPAQSGSDRILSLMKRGYSTADYRKAVAALRSAIPGISLTTDIIVGYPTESELDFEMTRQFMNEIRFDNSFIFKYSPRPGTVAATVDNDVPAEEKLRRNRILLDDQDACSLVVNGELVGTEVQVLVEGPSLRDSTRWAGRTRTNKIAIVQPLDGMLSPCLVDVLIERRMPQTLYGRIVRCLERYDIQDTKWMHPTGTIADQRQKEP